MNGLEISKKLVKVNLLQALAYSLLLNSPTYVCNLLTKFPMMIEAAHYPANTNMPQIECLLQTNRC